MISIIIIVLEIWTLIGIIYACNTNHQNVYEHIPNTYKKCLYVFIHGPLFWLLCGFIELCTFIQKSFNLSKPKFIIIEQKIINWFKEKEPE